MQNTNNITVKQGQSLFDIAIQECGSVEAVFLIARQNSIPVTKHLTTGEQLQPVGVTDKRVKKYYTDNHILPATSLTTDAFLPEGIDYWAIEFDFEIQ